MSEVCSEVPADVGARLTVDVVVVNWNSGSYLDACLASLPLNSDKLASNPIVVDNASADGSAQVGRDGVTLLKNDVNKGFAAACNQGAALGSAPFILFLNPDTRLNADSLPVALKHLNSDPEIGVVGIQLVDLDNNVQRSCARAPTFLSMLAHALGIDRVWLSAGYVMRDWPHNQTRDVDHVVGAFYLIRRDLFAALGGFDERFFVYLEDLDLSKRVRDAGSRICFLAAAQAFHAGGGSSRSIPGHRQYLSLRARLQYVEKHFKHGQRLVIVTATLLVEPLIRMVAALLHGSLATVAHTVSAYRSLWRWWLG